MAQFPKYSCPESLLTKFNSETRSKVEKVVMDIHKKIKLHLEASRFAELSQIIDETLKESELRRLSDYIDQYQEPGKKLYFTEILYLDGSLLIKTRLHKTHAKANTGLTNYYRR